MKTKRSLSGIYYRFLNPETDKWENWCFEDLPSEMQTEIIRSKSPEWVNSLAISLADTLNEIGDALDLCKE